MDYFKKIIFILLLIFNFSIANASTSEFIGVIGAAIGEIKNQKEEVLINGSKIYYGDTIIVGQQSNAQILLRHKKYGFELIYFIKYQTCVYEIFRL